MRVGIGIGSNQGDRLSLMERAMAFLKGLDPQARFSRIYESEPMDCPEGSGLYLNAAAELEWGGDLYGLLDRLQAFEMECGRGKPGERGVNLPRPIDLDILYADNLELRSGRLAVPHPRMEERLFVLLPLCDLCPGRQLAKAGISCKEKAGQLQASSPGAVRPLI
jgi:2-amino-4-hydroxy-6-hydroxymethyldihydropteridine diphosphokinase